MNGYGDEMLYERGAIATNLPFAEMKPRCLINEHAREADKADDFAQRIRQGVPGTQPGNMKKELPNASTILLRPISP